MVLPGGLELGDFLAVRLEAGMTGRERTKGPCLLVSGVRDVCAVEANDHFSAEPGTGNGVKADQKWICFRDPPGYLSCLQRWHKEGVKECKCFC